MLAHKRVKPLNMDDAPQRGVRPTLKTTFHDAQSVRMPLSTVSFSEVPVTIDSVEICASEAIDPLAPVVLVLIFRSLEAVAQFPDREPYCTEKLRISTSSRGDPLLASPVSTVHCTSMSKATSTCHAFAP